MAAADPPAPSVAVEEKDKDVVDRRADRLKKFISSEEFASTVTSFMNEGARQFMVVTEGAAGFTLAAEVAERWRGAALCFTKLVPEAVTAEVVARRVAVMDVGGPLGSLRQLVEDVYLPLLNCPLNQEGWTEVVAQDLAGGARSFASMLQMAEGHTRGDLVLPLPPEDCTNLGETERMHLFENVLVIWTKLLKELLRSDPATALDVVGGTSGPMTEMRFWERKTRHLNSLFVQLQAPRVREMLRELELMKSTFVVPIAKLCRDIFEARVEANDTMRYMQVLWPWCVRFEETTEFEELVPLFRPVMHLLLRIWRTSRYYNTPGRIIVIIREFSNSVILHAQRYLPGTKIFELVESDNSADMVKMLLTVLRVCGVFKGTYFDYKAQSTTDCSENPWKMQNAALFTRLDSFLERCHDLRDFASSIVEFSKLAKLEIGGTKGKTLTTSVQQIHADFGQAVTKFRAVKYDIMDIDERAFDDDFYAFRSSVKELERRLASVLSQAFDDAATISGRFKLLDSFEGLLGRPSVSDELERKQLDLMASFSADLAHVQAEFHEGKRSPPISHNLPPIAGAITWCRGLVARVEVPMTKLRSISRSVLDRDDAKPVIKAYTSFVATVHEYEHAKIEEWGKHIEASSQAQLKLPLLAAADHDDNLLMVNFDPSLVRLLREVKYFLLADLAVPESALQIYAKAEVFRKFTGNLDLIVNMYNAVQTQLLPVERPLMKASVDKVEAALRPGLQTLNWKSHGIDMFVTEAMVAVKTTNTLMESLSTNLKGIQKALDQFAKEPVFARRAKAVSCDEFDKIIKDVVVVRTAEIEERGRAIKNHLRNMARDLKVSAGQADWKYYVDFVNNIVVAGLVKAALRSLVYINEQLDREMITRESKSPLVEIELDLIGRDVRFKPNIGQTALGDSLWDRVLSWTDNAVAIGNLLGRLDAPTGSYVREILQDPGVQMQMQVVSAHMFFVEDECAKLQAQFMRFDFLWSSDMTVAFSDFLAKAHAVPAPPRVRGRRPSSVGSSDDMSAAAATSSVPKAPVAPAGFLVPPGADGRVIDLAAFNAKIEYYRDIQAQAEKLPSLTDIAFVRVNSQPVKQSLSTWITRWMFLFSQYLHDHVVASLRFLDDFERTVNDGLEAVTRLSDEGVMMSLVTHIRNVRRIMDPTSRMFGPLKEIVALLKSHGIVMDGVIGGTPVLEYMEQAQMKWDNTVNNAFRVKELIRERQLVVAEQIKADIALFASRVSALDASFRDQGPFRVRGTDAVNTAYAQIDEYVERLRVAREEQQRFSELEELFELVPTKHARLPAVESDLCLVKAGWDMFAHVESCFAKWETLLWGDIHPDDLLEETRQLQLQAKALPARVRVWEFYNDMTTRLANFATTLPMILDLSASYMRDRHWKDLMIIAGHTVEKGMDFCMRDVLSLELHQHVSRVQDIIELAQKQAKIDARLSAIEQRWASCALVFVQYNTSETRILSPPDGALDDLEEHMMALQGMASMGKFVEFFQARVDEWQRVLSATDTVLKLWIHVQRMWSSLEAIFMTSQDIRAQLPDDSKRFEATDQEYKDLLREAEINPIVVAACSGADRLERLTAMLHQFERCQKALSEYLDIKKVMFPRFYFVANAALLDILANGYNPSRIMKHLGDCFDALTDLVLEASRPAEARRDGGPAPEPHKDLALAMIAKDGEIVEFPTGYLIRGPVEIWLHKLVLVMQDALKLQLEAAIEAAANWEVDNPREQWLFNYAAQVVVLAAQIYWTEEVEGALEDMETGSEDSMKKYYTVCAKRLSALIAKVLGSMGRAIRNKVITLITIDVHARDVVQGIIDKKSTSPNDFAWQSQLRYYWRDESRDCDIKIVDYKTWYCYEYIGNCGRLVITPLTDRCYITLSMAMRLMLGGAPAGPAGTGKTETTKDLARSGGLMCYVFNCSDQMNYQTMGEIFKGLAQTGAWGCFDEFNRINVEVLSVVATQVEAVLDAIRYFALKQHRLRDYQALPEGRPPAVVGQFDFLGTKIALVPTCGFFITMNPGYAGRTELPENLKVLFRSCAMIRPDLALICENMLMSEGFQKARPLSIKFVTLYRLASELLAPEVHYDWGLRAIKAVLRVAGALKRAELEMDEEVVLMRALRDFSMPKITARDAPIFMRLISGLFPGRAAEVKVDAALRDTCSRVCALPAVGLQAEDGFVAKVDQFAALLEVRHSVMLLGPAGCGKTTVWTTLAACLNVDSPKPVALYEVINPKAVTADELYGYMTLAKDWRDGVLSIVMRAMSKNTAPYTAVQTAKWVVLDGDIDAVWIESMNTVMDDNKMLTLVSNERIPLSAAMRMVFEVSTLVNATPATVSRAGILYICDDDIGWSPLVHSWAQTRDEKEAVFIPQLFYKYVDQIQRFMRVGRLVHVTPLLTISMVETTTKLLGMLLAQLKNKTNELMEAMFCYAAVWAFGGGLSSSSGSVDAVAVFDRLWRDEIKLVKYPAKGTVFDYCIEERVSPDGAPLNAGEDPYVVVPWESRVDAISVGDELSVASIIVPTVNSTRLTFWLDHLVRVRAPVLLVGAAGTGKTTIAKQYISRLVGDDGGLNSAVVNMSYFTDARALQESLELHLDRRSGRYFGPPGNRRLIVLLDDLNMPVVEEYGTQTPIALLRQFMDYAAWYDREDPSIKKLIKDVQFVSCMNHKAGSFSVDPRLQRHFATFAVDTPSSADLRIICGSILDSFLSNFVPDVARMASALVESTIELRALVAANFLPSAVRFVYNFNMREVGNVMQGLCRASADVYSRPTMGRLWLHECSRVFEDRMMTPIDIERFGGIVSEVAKKSFDVDSAVLLAKPLVFTAFVSPTGGAADNSAPYLPVRSREALFTTISAKLREYNEGHSMMDLVLFEQALAHVARIARILGMPRGNALLVGVGGSGKQSLCRLAAYICGMPVQTIIASSSFGLNELRETLKDLFRKAGVRPAEPIVLLLTDQQIVNERFLVYINELLASGFIPEIFNTEELDSIFQGLRAAAKAAAIGESREAMREFFGRRVRANLHVVLCFSPVGDHFRIRARRFPALINCTQIDWFHPWGKDALISVARTFLEAVPFDLDVMRDNLSHHMAELHLSVTAASEAFRAQAGRYNYITPKSFMQLISFYSSLLGERRAALNHQVSRLATGLDTLRRTHEDVTKLQEELRLTLIRVDEKRAAMEVLLDEMGRERGEAQAQEAVARVEQAKADAANKSAAQIEAKADLELTKAKPALEAAAEAVKCLSKASLTELKSLGTPPAGVDMVTKAVLIVLNNERRNFSWDTAKKMMAKVDQFKTRLEQYDARKMEDDVVDRVEAVIKEAGGFYAEDIAKKSVAAANLATWVVNIVQYKVVYKKVAPLMADLDAAKRSKALADEQLEGVQRMVAEVEARLGTLQRKFVKATNQKSEVEDEARVCTDRLGLANRLVNGLASENTRWANEIHMLGISGGTLAGDVMLACAFVSYAGAFDGERREVMWRNEWLRDLQGREILTTPDVNPLSVLADDARTAEWLVEGLPADRMSIENGAIVSCCKRWPLLIDPQLQGVTWIKGRKNRDGRPLVVLQLSQKSWMKRLEAAITAGDAVLLEDIGQDLDAALEPLLSRSVQKSGRSLYLRMGESVLEYDPNFSLVLQTKLANPHYRPELQAQCTLVNFIVTERGLEGQLLAKVVSREQSELEDQMRQLQKDMNMYKIQLKSLEDQLLERLASAPADILSDVALIEGLEATKEKVMEIVAAVHSGRETEKDIQTARDVYRPVAVEGSLLFFTISRLNVVDKMYEYSLASFVTFFFKGMMRAVAKKTATAKERVEALIKAVRFTIFAWAARGLFEKDRLSFLTHVTFELIRSHTIGDDCGYSPELYNLLVHGCAKADASICEFEWMPQAAWANVCGLSAHAPFEALETDLVNNSSRFQEWFDSATPEFEKLPLDWRELDRTPFVKLLVIRAMRPDRMSSALTRFVADVLPDGPLFTEFDRQLTSFQILGECFADSAPSTPIYLILSPGSDVVADVDRLARRVSMEKGVSYHNISLGQGQDRVANEVLATAMNAGHWVLLNNVHLMPRWLEELDKVLEGEAHKNFRVFLSSDRSDAIPVSLLGRSIKLTNQPPSGVKANIQRAFASFSQQEIDDLDSRTRSILFGLCYFHAIMLERKKFGPQGFNMTYAFSSGDLLASTVVLRNYMENASATPWEDLRYLFGEIMYGGHIVNDFDRDLCNKYLEYIMRDELLDEMEMFPFTRDKASFRAPQTLTMYERYMQHINDNFKEETPLAFGLHPNAEIGFRTEVGEGLFATIAAMRPIEVVAVEGESNEHIAGTYLLDVLEEYREASFDIAAVRESVGDAPGPFQTVFTQECEAMNALVAEIVRSLAELDLGLRGDLQMSEQMDSLLVCLLTGKVPNTWQRLAYPSLRGLASWLVDLRARRVQLQEWVEAPVDLPTLTWLGGLFNPQSFLTAVLQSTAERTRQELDRLVIICEVTKKAPEMIDGPSRDGGYIRGLYLEGARYDVVGGWLEECAPREMYFEMPVINLHAVVAGKENTPNMTPVPVYRTRQRNRTYVFTARLRSQVNVARWAMAGVAIVLEIT